MISMDKKYLGVMMEAGYIYIGMRRFTEAREMFEGLSVLAPDSDIPLVALGNVAFCEGKMQRATRYYKQALKLDPESVFAKVYLGETLFFAGHKDEAMELLEGVGRSNKGGAGEFARELIGAIKKGFSPPKTKQR